MEKICGEIEHIVFESEKTGFVVAKVLYKNSIITITGVLPKLSPGEQVSCTGKWQQHSLYGQQFAVEHIHIQAPCTIEGVQRYLESGLVKGIGPIYAQRIVRAFGEKTLEIIDNHPAKLLNVEGIGHKRLEIIKKYWSEQQSIRSLMLFLQSHAIKTSIAHKIYKTYGAQSIEKIRSNPFALAKNIFGIGFKSADELAQKLGHSLDSHQRISSAVEYVLFECTRSGHVCYPKSALIDKVVALLCLAPERITLSISKMLEQDELLETHLPIKGTPTPLLWLRPLYFAEMTIAQEIKRLLQTKILQQIDVETDIKVLERHLNILLAEEQTLAIQNTFKNPVHIITGGPGTGKSTLTKVITLLCKNLKKRVLLAAPTGRAAKRLSEITRKKASTIHSLLEYDFTVGSFRRNQQNPLHCDLLIVDEASMIDTYLMACLLKAVPLCCTLLFIGDVDQLPSVGPGNVLKELIESQQLPCTFLKSIFRQKQRSRIVINAHKIKEGIFPDLSYQAGSDFVFWEGESPEDIAQKIVHLVATVIPSRFHFNPVEDIQVLSPMKKGLLGTEHLNYLLQEKLNPNAVTLSRNTFQFRVKDKVMQIANNYSKGVFNGDIGTIVAIDLDEQEVHIRFDTSDVFYDFSELDEVMLAYACSIHKYQGSECRCIVMPIHISHFKLLFRNLFYTGVTRGKQLVVVVGSKKAIGMSVATDDANKRYTALGFALQQMLCACP